ncbi:hypothetical protein H920_15057 [Fukomys damarensis]|uniref:Uncharacterized protein n=1 Tax=Fukomys damarensis TaxID=885580 RepID=A0A091CZY6_FUKDA|nr:hypothetical protein H920_15057 [Fukomys damarensis]
MNTERHEQEEREGGEEKEDEEEEEEEEEEERAHKCLHGPADHSEAQCRATRGTWSPQPGDSGSPAPAQLPVPDNKWQPGPDGKCTMRKESESKSPCCGGPEVPGAASPE